MHCPAQHLPGSKARGLVCLLETVLPKAKSQVAKDTPLWHRVLKEARKPCEAGNVPAIPKTLCTVAQDFGNYRSPGSNWPIYATFRSALIRCDVAKVFVLSDLKIIDGCLH